MGAELLLGTETQTDIPFVLRKYGSTIERLKASPIFQGHDIPHGEGQHVFLTPGLYESDKALTYIERFLRTIGYIPEPSGLGTNLGQPWQQEFMRKKIHDLIQKFGSIYSIGHSFGGFGLAQIAQTEPGLKKVIAIASPFIGGIDSTGDTFMESIYSENDTVVRPFMSKFRGQHTRNVEVFSPEHIEHVCDPETFKEVGIALAA